MKCKTQKVAKGTKANPIVKNGHRYIFNKEGRLVRLEYFDPNTMEKFTLTDGTTLDEKDVECMRDFASKPDESDEECPELTGEKLRIVNGL